MTKVQVTKIAALTGHQGSIYTLGLTAFGASAFLSGSGDGAVIRWDLNETDKATQVASVGTNIFSLMEIPEKNLLLLGQLQGGIHVLDLVSKKEIKHLALHKNGVFDLQRLNDNTFVAAGGDGTLSVWSLEDFSLIRQVPVAEGSIRSIALHPNEGLIALGCSDHKVYILQRDSLAITHILEGHENSVFSVCFSPDGKYLLSGSRDAHLRVWDVGKKYELSHALPAHLFTINSIVYHPDGTLFATGSRDKTIKIWDAESFELLKVVDAERLGGHVNSVNKLMWVEHRNYLISCSDDRAIMVWEIAKEIE